MAQTPQKQDQTAQDDTPKSEANQVQEKAKETAEEAKDKKVIE